MSDSPSSAGAVTTPVTVAMPGIPVSFTMTADGSAGEFSIDLSSKNEKRKSRPPRPPPPGRRLSRPISDAQSDSEAVDGIRNRALSVLNMDGGPPDSITCVRFACTFTKKNGELTVYFRMKMAHVFT